MLGEVTWAVTGFRFKDKAVSKSVYDPWVAVASGLASLVPDYSEHPGTFILEQEASKYMDSNTSIDEVRAFYQGALSVLVLLGDNETRDEEHANSFARRLTHECKYFLK